MQIKVAKVIDEYTLVLNKGSSDGIKEGQRFLIYSVGEEVKDPDMGISLGMLELVRGTGKARHVQERMCTVTSDMTQGGHRAIRRPAKSGYRPLHMVLLPEEIEEIIPGQKVPFNAPEVGDFAKPV